MGIILVGASPKARILLDMLYDESNIDEITGLVDRDVIKHGTTYFGKPILGDIDAILSDPRWGECSFCVCLSDKRFADRWELMHKIENAGRQFSSIISKESHIVYSALISPGAYIMSECIIRSFTRIGTCTSVLVGAYLAHDVIIGAGSVVTKDVPDGVVVVGNPARILKENKAF